MSSIFTISLSGMNAAQTRLDSSSHNIANHRTAGFKRQQVVPAEQPTGGLSITLTRAADAGVAIETDLAGQLQAKNAFLANLAVFRTGDQLMGALLDLEG